MAWSDVIHPPDACKLGKLVAKTPHVMLVDYVDLDEAAKRAPASVDNTNGDKIQLAMYSNDIYGDCTCAGIGNGFRLFSADGVEISDQSILSLYETVTSEEGAAFSPGPPPENDNGAVCLDVLDLVAKNGIEGHEILGHAGVNPHSAKQRLLATWQFGALYVGIQLTVAQQTQKVWSNVPNDEPWGGHCVIVAAVNPGKLNKIGTWGAWKEFDDSFWLNFDEAHVLVTKEWAARNASNPLFNVDALLADLKAYQPEK